VSYDLRAHTADIVVAARGATLAETFAAVADGLAAACCDEIPDTDGERFDLAITATDREGLLYDYLAELIYERDVRAVLPVDNEVTIDHDGEGWHLSASARGVPLDRIDAREIKAVTYSDMELAETAAGWRSSVVFDV
jgi:SHS2 domain-containing protein